MILNAIVVIMALVWIGIPIYGRLTRAKRRCPHCQSDKIEILSKEPEGQPIIHGGRVSATVTYHYRFHCKTCRQRWEKSETESW